MGTWFKMPPDKKLPLSAHGTVPVAYIRVSSIILIKKQT
jgi:hypothetical protein